MRKKYTATSLSLTLILLLLLTMMQPVYASPLAEPQEPPIMDSVSGGMGGAAPNNRPLSSLEELVEWHTAPFVWGEFPVLAEDIIVDRQVTLSETAKGKDLGAIEHGIRVITGGSLTLDNSKLNITALVTTLVPTIVVESGGELVLLNGVIWPVPNATTIVVEKGGRLVKSDEFLVNGGKILDKNELPTNPEEKPNPPPIDPEPEPNPPPAEPEEKPDPQPPPLPAISNTMGFDYSLSCLLGEPPASSDYPSTEWVTYETADNVPMQKELPVRWELDAVDFGVAGTYAVKGIFSEEVLTSNGLSNPNNISSTLQLTVIKPSALDTLTGNVLSVGSKGNCHIRLALPPLPEGATALYIHRSADGKNWQKAVQETYTNGHIPSSYDNFLPHAMITPTKLYVQYRYQTDYRPIWLRVEVVGSAVAGISNEIKLEMPLSAKPGDSTNTGETSDDDSSGGNRGGGGQSESDRDLPNVPEEPSEDKTLPADKLPSVPTTEQTQGGTIPLKNSVVGGISKGEPSSSTAPQDGISNDRPPASTSSDAKNQEETYLFPLPKQEAEPTAIEVQALSGEVQGSQPLLPKQEAEPTAIEVQTLSGEVQGSQPLLPKQETEPTAIEVQALSSEVQGNPPLQKSRGVFLTAGATAFVAGALLLLRKL